MLRITKQTDYGLIALTQLAAEPERVRSAGELAAAGGLPAPMVSKVLKVLGRAGLVASVRGMAGGYRLAREPEDLTVAEIVAALEGPIAITDCLVTAEVCQHQALCPTHNHWHLINSAIQGALNEVTLADLVRPLRGGRERAPVLLHDLALAGPSGPVPAQPAHP
ncbi:MAG: SUF system Fe-S cluster assembly regulator [Anaerolineae bacterium]|jgi:FeS assembly SUF system regulator|nr:SUF system Fe-S cluster assembly regulator [Ardenticatenia bacterium]HQZ71274.1 SUF system Fe-S cluster assembly regulator [Anaerolineae bacterium]HRA19294.1 SUF system Fe-S cluster assembly regulator [Anaerolineae bacterium]